MDPTARIRSLEYHWSLLEFLPARIPRLAQLLFENPPVLQQFAAFALGELAPGNEMARQAMRFALAHPSPFLREYALTRWRGRPGDQPPEAHLLTYADFEAWLEDWQEQVPTPGRKLHQHAVEWGLLDEGEQEIDEESAQSVLWFLPEVASRYFEAYRLGEVMRQRRTDYALALRNPDPEIRRLGAVCLAQAGCWSPDALEPALADHDTVTRWVGLVGQAASQQTSPLFFEALDAELLGPDAERQQLALILLATCPLAPPSTRLALADLLQPTGAPPTLHRAIRAAGRIQCHEAEGALCRLLRHPRPLIESMAAACLFDLGRGDAAAAAVLRMAKDYLEGMAQATPAEGDADERTGAILTLLPLMDPLRDSQAKEVLMLARSEGRTPAIRKLAAKLLAPLP